MKVYSSVNGDFKELDEISFLIHDSKELLALKDFLEKCINSINNPEFSHEHFRDYLKNKTMQTPEIIICKE